MVFSPVETVGENSYAQLPFFVPDRSQANGGTLEALTYMVNSISETGQIMQLPSGPEKKISNLNLGPYLSTNQIALLAKADPSRLCTGRIRVNRLAYYLSQSDLYYEITNAPKSVVLLANRYGVPSVKTGRYHSYYHERPLDKPLFETRFYRTKFGGYCIRTDLLKYSKTLSDISTPEGAYWGELKHQYDIGDQMWSCQGKNGFSKDFFYNEKGKLKKFTTEPYLNSQAPVYNHVFPHLRKEVAYYSTLPELNPLNGKSSFWSFEFKGRDPNEMSRNDFRKITLKVGTAFSEPYARANITMKSAHEATYRLAGAWKGPKKGLIGETVVGRELELPITQALRVLQSYSETPLKSNRLKKSVTVERDDFEDNFCKIYRILGGR